MFRCIGGPIRRAELLPAVFHWNVVLMVFCYGRGAGFIGGSLPCDGLNVNNDIPCGPKADKPMVDMYEKIVINSVLSPPLYDSKG